MDETLRNVFRGWDILPGAAINPNDFAGNNRKGVFDDGFSKLLWLDCMEWEAEDGEKSERCCICVNMAWKWGQRGDVPECDECDDGNPSDRPWTD